jgi:hypothetical protein
LDVLILDKTNGCLEQEDMERGGVINTFKIFATPFITIKSGCTFSNFFISAHATPLPVD